MILKKKLLIIKMKDLLMSGKFFQEKVNYYRLFQKMIKIFVLLFLLMYLQKGIKWITLYY